MLESLVVEVVADGELNALQIANELVVVSGAESALILRNELSHVADLIGVLEYEAMASPTNELVDLLMCTHAFVKAVMQLDLDKRNRSIEAACYDSLAAIKQELQRIMWSRALI